MKTAERRGNDDPWSELASALTEEELRYLEALSAGKGTKRLLKSMGMTASQAQDAINAKAMDTVGDILIEDESVIQEYADDIRTILS